MERKTRISCEEGQYDLVITREFELPVELLFQAHADAEIVAQWMDNTVIKFEARKHGGWQYQKTDKDGNIVFAANGVFHEFIPDQKIIRTFEMENTPFPAQLEFLDFEALTDKTSRLTMQIVYRSVADRDRMLQLPFAQGINMAHDRLQQLLQQKN